MAYSSFNFKPTQHSLTDILNWDSLQVYFPDKSEAMQRQRERGAFRGCKADVLRDWQHEAVDDVSINGDRVNKRVCP